jgi:ABC-2 type transport system permease protein
MIPNALRLYIRYIGISFRSQMQYRASFVMLSIGHFLITGIEFLGIWVLFDRFGSLQGWALPEVAMLYGMVNIAFAITDGTSRGFDTFAFMIKSGDFDRLLLRPRSTALQVAGQELTLRRVGRFSQGLIVLLWAASELGIVWSSARIALTIGAILGGSCLFYGILILQATLAFWTTETLEIMNTVTYGGVETTQYPLTIYRPWFRRFFTLVIPLACVTYFPALAILGRTDPLGTPVFVQWTAPVVGVMFLAVTLQVWKIGVRHYRSTGS